MRIQRLHRFILSAMILLVACTPTPAAAPDELVREAVARPEQRAARVLGYVTRAANEVRLVAALRPSAGGWAGAGDHTTTICVELAQDQIERVGEGIFAPAAVSGTFAAKNDGGATCGSRLSNAQLEFLTAREATIETLLRSPAEYEGALVRVSGAILARPDAGLLLDQLSAGGVPAPGARQIKLAGPIEDALLPPALRQSAGGVRFGVVQIEGLWRDGALVPLAIAPITP